MHEELAQALLEWQLEHYPARLNEELAKDHEARNISMIAFLRDTLHRLKQSLS
jgi:hypothetical protein